MACILTGYTETVLNPTISREWQGGLRTPSMRTTVELSAVSTDPLGLSFNVLCNFLHLSPLTRSMEIGTYCGVPCCSKGPSNSTVAGFFLVHDTSVRLLHQLR